MTERLIVVDHVLFVVEDFPASRRLYTAALAPLGLEELYVEPNCISYGRQQLDDFSICEGSPVTTAAHVAFDAADRSQVDAFFEAALAAGATTRGEPGVWIQYSRPVLRGVRERPPRQQRRGRVPQPGADHGRPGARGRSLAKSASENTCGAAIVVDLRVSRRSSFRCPTSRVGTDEVPNRHKSTL